MSDRLLVLLYFFVYRELSIKDLESSLQQKKDDIARFEEERTDLIAKVKSAHIKSALDR